MRDPEAPTGSGFWHWTVYNIPATATSIPPGANDPNAGLLPGTATEGYVDFGRPGYGGPCPPAGDPPHHYEIRLAALSAQAMPVFITEIAPAALIEFAASTLTISAAITTVAYPTGTGKPSIPVIPSPSSFVLASNDIPAGSMIDNKFVLNNFGCSGMNISPELHWSGAPTGTQSFALTVFDPDAPTESGFWHWLAFDIESSTTQLNQGDSAPNGTPAISLAGGLQGYNDAAAKAYSGPCPPVGPAHTYTFTVYALPVQHIGTTAKDTGGRISFALLSMATAKASFTAQYGRSQ
jgi:Raf kinase inhibitor-like YbhB/YbcL family protein